MDAHAASGDQVCRDIVVVGTSAGGVQALQELVRGLPQGYGGAVFVVMHTSPLSPAVLPMILDRASQLPCTHAVDGEPIRRGRVYVAPPDTHLLLKLGRMLLTHGPKENGFRPAVDPLFRTAARAFGPRVVGVILTGGLDDGTFGLLRIKEEGGCAIVQDPREAVFAGMCQSAIDNVDVDYVLPIAQIPAMLVRLATRPLSQPEVAMAANRPDVQDTAEAGQASMRVGNLPAGQASGLICPECGGALWEAENGKVTRFQCHVGHSYTAETLMAEKDGELENALWTALRAMEEAAELRRRTAARLEKAPFGTLREKCLRESAELEERASVLRGALTGETRTPHAVIDAKIKTRASKRSNGRSNNGQHHSGRRHKNAKMISSSSKAAARGKAEARRARK